MSPANESLEGRLRAAMREEAEEIAPDEVPPLGPGGRFTISAPPGRVLPRPGRRRWARWGVPLTAAAAVVAVASLVLGTGAIGGRPARSAAAPGPGASPATASRPAGFQPGYPANLVSGLTGEFLPASGAQFMAGGLFSAEYTALANQMLARCMAAHGFPGAPVQPALKGAGAWDLTQFPDLEVIARTGTLPGDTAVIREQPSASYRKAMDACRKAIPDPFQPMMAAGRSLTGPWITTVTVIQASAPVQATIPALRACAARYGWPRDSEGNNRPLDSFSDFVTWVSTFLDGPLSRGASDATMSGLRRQWGPRFVECSRPTVSVMEQRQLAAQRSFLRAHARQFAALVALARAGFAAAEGAAGRH